MIYTERRYKYNNKHKRCRCLGRYVHVYILRLS